MDGQVCTTVLGGDKVESEVVLLAIGRSSCAKTDERGYVVASATMQTNLPHIYAVGDVGMCATPVDMALVHVPQAEEAGVLRATSWTNRLISPWTTCLTSYLRFPWSQVQGCQKPSRASAIAESG